MAIDATFWVAISFVIFIGVLVYFKIPQKVSHMLDGMISDIKNEIDESEKLRTEAKTLLDNAQKKLDTASSVSNEILENAKKESDKLIIDLSTEVVMIFFTESTAILIEASFISFNAASFIWLILFSAKLFLISDDL